MGKCWGRGVDPGADYSVVVAMDGGGDYRGGVADLLDGVAIDGEGDGQESQALLD